MLTVVPHILQDLNMTTQNIKELNQHAKQHHSTTKTTSENNNITHHITTKTHTIIKKKSKTCTILGEEKQNDILQTIL